MDWYLNRGRVEVSSLHDDQAGSQKFLLDLAKEAAAVASCKEFDTFPKPAQGPQPGVYDMIHERRRRALYLIGVREARLKQKPAFTALSEDVRNCS
jgi:hypothetical protein